MAILTIDIPDEYKEKLKEMAENEGKKEGIKLSLTNLMRRIIADVLNNENN